MATKKPIDALNYAKRMVKNMPVQDMWVEMTNDILSRIWMESPWSWTLGSFPIINLVATNQDYTVSIPSDFLYLRESTIVSLTVARPLQVVATIPNNVSKPGQPTCVCVIGNPGETGTVRVSPIPINSNEALSSLYKKTLTLYTKETLYTDALPIPDEWYHVFQAGILWLAYKYADDGRAGEASARNDGGFSFNGQRGQFEADLIKMRNREPMALDDALRLMPDAKEDK